MNKNLIALVTTLAMLESSGAALAQSTICGRLDASVGTQDSKTKVAAAIKSNGFGLGGTCSLSKH